jgi:hypothetical protein
MEVEIVLPLARASVARKSTMGYSVAHVAGVRVPEPVCTDDVAGAADLGFDEIPGYRLVEQAITLRAEDWSITPVAP